MSTTDTPGTAAAGGRDETSDNLVRDMVRRRHQRRRTVLVSLAATVVVLGGALLGAWLVRTNTREVGETPDRVPAGATEDGAGLELHDGPVVVDLYLDYLCPACRDLERGLAPRLEALAAEGEVTVVYHPVAFLDDHSTPGGYSTRAASAAGCAADEAQFEEYSAVLYDRQPPERGPGLDQSQLIAAGEDVGITGDDFAACVRDRTYEPWVRYVSDAATADDVAATPVVEVDGRRVDIAVSDPDAAVIRAITEAGP